MRVVWPGHLPPEDVRGPGERSIDGVAFPGHFLLRVAGDDEASAAMILDPFAAGVELVGSFTEVRTVAEVIATVLADYEAAVSSLPRLAPARV